MRDAWLVFILAWGLMSCDPGVEIENIPVDKLLSVSAVVSPRDSSLKVHVFRASGLSERIPYDRLIEKDARVTISDGTREAVLSYYPDNERYEYKNPFHHLEAGSGLTLTVQTQDGVTATGHSVIPPKPQLVSFTHHHRNDFLVYELVWNNPEAHKYFQAWQSMEFASNHYPGEIRYLKNSSAIMVEPEVFLWDRQPGGINIIRDSVRTNPGRLGPAKASFTLANFEESLWKYIRTSSQYNTWLTNAEESGILPVFKEPVDVSNNIKGGFGIQLYGSPASGESLHIHSAYPVVNIFSS